MAPLSTIGVGRRYANGNWSSRGRVIFLSTREIRSRTVIGVELELPRQSDSFSEGNRYSRLHWSRARGMKTLHKGVIATAPKVHHPKDCCCVSLRDQLVDYTQTSPPPFACKMILLVLHRKRSRFQSRHTSSPSTMSLATSAAMLTVDSQTRKLQPARHNMDPMLYDFMGFC